MDNETWRTFISAPALVVLQGWRQASDAGRQAGLHLVDQDFPERPDRSPESRNGPNLRLHAVAREAIAGAAADAAAGLSTLCLVHHDRTGNLGLALVAAAEMSHAADCVIAVVDRAQSTGNGPIADCRVAARDAALPVLEIGDPDDFPTIWQAARQLSEEFVCPVVLRLVSASSVPRDIGQPASLQAECPANLPTLRSTGSPPSALTRRAARLRELSNFADTSPFNALVRAADRRIGYVVSGFAYPLVRARHPDAMILRVGLVHPLPLKQIRGIVEMCQAVVVVEVGSTLIARELAGEGLCLMTAGIAYEAG